MDHRQKATLLGIATVGLIAAVIGQAGVNARRKIKKPRGWRFNYTKP